MSYTIARDICLPCRRLVWPTNPHLFLIRKVIAIELALIFPPLSLPSSLKRALSRNQSRRLAPSLAPSSAPLFFPKPTDRPTTLPAQLACLGNFRHLRERISASRPLVPSLQVLRPSARAYCIETPNLNGRKNRHIQFYERSGAR